MSQIVKLKFRILEEDDLPQVHAFYRTAEVIWGTAQIPSLQLGWTRRWLTNSEDYFTLVAQIGEGPYAGRVVGTSGVQRGSGRQRHVVNLGLAVDPEFQGQGVGTALMQKALEMAEKYYCPLRMQLEVYPDNKPAVRLYQKLGFRVEGRLRDYIIREGTFVDVLCMSKIAGECVDGVCPVLTGQEKEMNVWEGFSTEVNVRSRDLEIRPPEPKDAEAIVGFYRNEGVLRNSTFLPWTIPSQAKIREELESSPPPRSRSHVFIAVQNNEVLGEIKLQPGNFRRCRLGVLSLRVIPPGHYSSANRALCGSDTCDVSYSLRQAQQVASSLLDAVIDLADNWFMLHRLELCTYSDEMWVFPVLRNKGFVQEAALRKASLRDGVFEDQLVWGRLNNK